MQELYCVKMATHVYLVPTLRMRGAIPPFFMPYGIMLTQTQG
jgi:hypothetical protein